MAGWLETGGNVCMSLNSEYVWIKRNIFALLYRCWDLIESFTLSIAWYRTLALDAVFRILDSSSPIHWSVMRRRQIYY